MSTTVDSSTLTHEERALMARGVEEHQDELIQSELDAQGRNIISDMQEVVSDMTLYTQFEDKMGGVNNELIQVDVGVDPYNYEYPFDDIEEVQRLKDKAQRLVNSAHGTRYEQSAKTILNTIEGEAGALVAIALNAENVTF